MSVVPFTSPLSSSGNTFTVVDHENFSSVSSLLADYTQLNSIVESSTFQQTLELYTLMLNSPSEVEERVPLETVVNQLLNDHSYILCNEWQELIEILHNSLFRSLIATYDLIVDHHSQQRHPSVINTEEKSMEKEKSPESGETSSIISSSTMIDEEKENANYASKLAEYNVTRLKIVRLDKRSREPLGATIRRVSDHSDRVCIGRLIHGGLAKGLFSVGDQILEVNDTRISCDHRTLDEIVELIDSLSGTFSFLLLPNPTNALDGNNNQAFDDQPDENCSLYVRALFAYFPSDDIYLPCRDLGLSFEIGNILQIVDCHDPSWWQAFRIENHPDETKHELPGLIPSKQFQEKRYRIVKCLLDEESINTKKLTKACCRQVPRQKILTTLSYRTYEPVQWYMPSLSRKRPIILIGPPHMGRHELRQRLMMSSELASLIDVAVPHTSRARKADEVDGRDYHFISRSQFEQDISSDLFVEHGEYQRNLYGTSRAAIEACCFQQNKVCILNLLPEALDSLRHSNLLPFVIYIQPPTRIDQLRKSLPVTDSQWMEIERKARDIEMNYGHLFDRTVCLNDSIDSIFCQLKDLVKDVQNRPMWVNQCWFPLKERF